MCHSTVIDRFVGEYRFLSNFYRCTIEFEGLLYASVEHAYQAAKTDDPELRFAMAQLSMPTTAKRMGHQLPLRASWDRMKLDIMRTLIQVKFTPGSVLADLLIDTHPARLIEGNTWGDTYWGVCRGKGLNNLGRLLMETRDLRMGERV